MEETGTGIGLPMVKKFVKLFEGEIEISSQGENRGTEVKVTLKQAWTKYSLSIWDMKSLISNISFCDVAIYFIAI